VGVSSVLPQTASGRTVSEGAGKRSLAKALRRQGQREFRSFPRSAWGRTLPTLCVDAWPRERPAIALPRRAWERENGPSGTSPNWNVKCHGKWKPTCQAFPSWTCPGGNIGLCENWLNSFRIRTWASLMIHELAHHYCTWGRGREKCAISAQTACP